MARRLWLVASGSLVSSEYVASYECSIDGWTWVTRLFPNEVVTTGEKGDERLVSGVELRHCTETPDWGVKEHVDWAPPRFWIAYLGAMLLTVAFFLSCYLSGVDDTAELAKVAVSTLVFELILLPGPLSRMLRKRRLQRYVTFKSAVDGKQLFTIFSALDADETFDDFVAEISCAIRGNKWQFKEL